MKEFNFSKLKIMDLQHFQHVQMLYAVIFSSYAFVKVVIKGGPPIKKNPF